MPKAIGQFTIYDFHDVYSGPTAPANPVLNMIWLDTSVNPPVMKVYNGSTWIVANDYTVGGRNLMVGSKSTDVFTAFTGGTNISMFYRTVTLTPDIKAGDKITVSLTFVYKNIVLVTGQESNAKIYIQGSGNVTGWSPGFGTGPNIISSITKGNAAELKYYQTYTFTLSASQVTNQTFSVGIRTDYIASGSLSISEMKVEKGDKATGWSQAPEDIDSITTSHTTQINSQLGQIQTLIQDTTIVKDGTTVKLKDDYSALVQDVAGFKTTVGSTYSTKTELSTFINGTYTPNLTTMQNTLDRKTTSYYQTTSPHTEYTAVADNATYNTWIGDLWYNSTSTVKKTYIYTKVANGTAFNYKWLQQEIPVDIFNTISGKKTIYTAKPTAYAVSDLWILESDTIHTAGKTGEILTCTTTSTSYNAAHWVKKIIYTDDTYAKGVESTLTQTATNLTTTFTNMHNGGYAQGITNINADGITVSHSNVLTKSKMSADGFSILDENDDVLAWLSSKKQWTELNVDKIYAGNILNTYQGPGTLYVNHSFTGDSDGSSTKPFSSFADLKSYLSATPIINIDLIINILDPGFEITEQLILNGIVGSGYLSIVYASTITHRARGNGAFAIRLYQIQKYVMISGGRSSYNATNGALITDDGNGHGIYSSDLDCLYIGYMSINCKNWGLVLERTRCYNSYSDFGKCYNAVELRDMSIYYQCDCCGGNTDFCRVKSGSLAFWGDDVTGIRPKGNVIASKGLYYSYGSGRTATDSFRFPTTSTTPTVPTTSNYAQSFSWTSHKTYAYSYSNWSDTDCKQGSWGYGLRGGHMFFDIAAIRSFLSGTVLDGNTITLTRASSGGLSGAANVYINGSTCSSASGTPGYSNQTLLGTLAWGETKTFTLPKAIVATLKAGTCSSLAVYVNSTAQNNYLNITNCSITLKVNK